MDVLQDPLQRLTPARARNARLVLDVLEKHRDDAGPLHRPVLESESGLHPRAVGRALKDLERQYIRVSCVDDANRFIGYRYLLQTPQSQTSSWLDSAWTQSNGSEPDIDVQPAWLRAEQELSNQHDSKVSNLRARTSYLPNRSLCSEETEQRASYLAGSSSRLPGPKLASERRSSSEPNQIEQATARWTEVFREVHRRDPLPEDHPERSSVWDYEDAAAQLRFRASVPW
jgi:hypothetical protein